MRERLYLRSNKNTSFRKSEDRYCTLATPYVIEANERNVISNASPEDILPNHQIPGESLTGIVDSLAPPVDLHSPSARKETDRP
jgi:hypothetical protein